MNENDASIEEQLQKLNRQFLRQHSLVVAMQRTLDKQNRVPDDIKMSSQDYANVNNASGKTSNNYKNDSSSTPHSATSAVFYKNMAVVWSIFEVWPSTHFFLHQY